uniref:Uncharacterized protein n=1 Tax=Aegilops tauschii subsp. strangulata TaxID=200361 RepID=A0A453RQ66_AEGTS
MAGVALGRRTPLYIRLRDWVAPTPLNATPNISSLASCTSTTIF